jgi:glycosyltransferase involved in cell wall biosynthesis
VIVQVFEMFSGGHHTKYVALLLAKLVQLREEGQLNQIIVTTSEKHYQSRDFADRLRRFVAQVDFDVIAGDFRPHRDARKITAILLDSVRRKRPDFVISPSANSGAFSLALRSLFRSPFAGITSVGIVHNGYSGPVHGLKHKLRDRVHRFSRRFSPWSELHVVNPRLHETVIRQGRWAAGRLKMLPDPVEAQQRLDKSVARAMIGLPLSGRYIGHIGASDGRKAIPELLAAFRAAKLNDDDRLFVAGRLHEPYRKLIDDKYEDLVTQGRLLLIDRHLSPLEFNAANCASDAVAVTYYTDELSSNLLAAVSAGRPVIASANGYTGMMIETFGVGWSCDVNDPGSVAKALHQAVNEAPHYQPSEKTAKLLRYHDPSNYVATLLRPLYARLGLPIPNLMTWEEVVQDTPPLRSHSVEAASIA